MADGSDKAAADPLLAELAGTAVATKKIAIVGSAPSSAGLAPYDDESWEIWACSGGTLPYAKRVTLWFELHDWKPDPSVYGWRPEYVEWLRKAPVPVVMRQAVPDVPSSIGYPEDAARREFGDSFWTSSVAWMMAAAILQNPEEIALFGIDMAARTEYEGQRSGVHFFAHMARQRGIKVTVPAQSDLLRPPPQYGMRADSPMVVKLMTRQKELQQRLGTLQQQQDAAFREQLFLQGALDDLDYMMKIMADQDPKSIAGG